MVFLLLNLVIFKFNISYFDNLMFVLIVLLESYQTYSKLAFLILNSIGF